MSEIQIKQLEELLKSHIDEDWCFEDYTSKRLTANGENYGSLILSLDVRFKNSKNEERLSNLVAKLIPENPWLREMFKVQDTFVKEMNFYAKVVPKLIEFQLEKGVEKTMEFFPKYYGGRINLRPDSTVVDEDGIIILENLKPDGYVTGDRTIGFNKEMVECILNDLAVFHAVPVAFKMEKPKVFEEEIKANIKFVKLFDSSDNEILEQMITKYEQFVREDPKGADAADRIRKAIMKCIENSGTLRDGPFATITHNDYWVNNTMLKFDECGKPIGNKMVDFQVVDYGSLGKDVVFFLFSSVQPEVLEEYCDLFLKLYYDKFIHTLLDLRCDTTPFTFDAFENELKTAAKDSEFFHCLVMTKILAASPKDIADLKDINKDDMIRQKINPRECSKVQFIVREFAKRNWI